MAEKQQCPVCKWSYTVNKDGSLRKHGCTPSPAPVSDPAPTVEPMGDTQDGPALGPREQLGEKGPWFGAMYDGRCSVSECRIEEGDRIRTDGQGGYECEGCGDSDTPGTGPHAHSTADAANAYGSMGGADLMDPAPVLPTADEFLDPAEPGVKLNVSGQPKARRDWQKRYILVDPDLGDFRRTVKGKKPKGITRATTFNKAAQNTTSLNAWGKRNVVMGATLRPDILRRAHGLTHETGKQELDRIVDELETAAGAKVAADRGSFLHEFCDEVDAGLKTWEDAPDEYQQDIKRYTEALAAAGLEPVRGLIERTVFIREYGGVAGTFDRIFYHRPSGQYIVGDLKTGKTMSYAMDETECQIFTYAHGVNQHGVYDWNTDTWLPIPFDPARGPVRVSETVGVIIHMPVQGPEAGEVYLRYADLECGRAYAELNHAVRSYPKSKVRPFEMPSAAPEEPVAQPEATRAPRFKRGRTLTTWTDKFSTVATREEANALYKEAKASGLGGGALRLLVDIGKETLTRLATQSEDQ